MLKRILILFIFVYPLLLFGQENTSITCGDGIDNDSDGLIDCLDGDCLALDNQGCAICSEGVSFADELIEYIPGCPLVDPLPEGALGVSDWNETVTDSPEFVFLGQGGSIKLGFTNNYITNSGDNQLDVWVFEVGPAVEASNISLRPLDVFTTTQLINLGLPDTNSDGFYELGTIARSTAGLDIDFVMPGYLNNELKFDAIEIQDVPDFPCGTTGTPGADIDAVCALSFISVDCLGIPNGIAIIDECGECLEPNDPTFNQSCTDCQGIPNGIAITDECGECLEPNDPTFNQSCTDCQGVPNGIAITDECGECLEPNDPTFNQSCADCQGVPNGIAITDECGECLEPNDPTFNQSCTDCQGVPNGVAITDECGECLEPNDPTFNQSCADCQGVPNGIAITDECGECLEPNDPTFNQSCTDCQGVPNGVAITDECGECLEPNDPTFNQSCADCQGVPNGLAVFDDCGECMEPSDPGFNQSCADCAGELYGSAIYNDCGECLKESDPYYNLTCAEKYKIYIPNVFSPNNDGINDKFQLNAAEGVVENIILYQIYNRWGELIYEQKNLLMNSNSLWWDGMFKNRQMQPAVFVYKIELLFANGDIRIFSGDVTLIK